MAHRDGEAVDFRFQVVGCRDLTATVVRHRRARVPSSPVGGAAWRRHWHALVHRGLLIQARRKRMLSPRGRKARNPSKAKGGLYLQSWATRDARGGPCQATAILSPPNATAILSPLIRVLVPPVWKEVPCGSSFRPAADGIWYGRTPRCKSVSTGPFASTIPTTAPSAPPASRTERLQENPMTLASRHAVCYRPRCRGVALLRRRPNWRTGCAKSHTPASFPRGTAPRPVAQTVASPHRGDGRGGDDRIPVAQG